MKQYIRYECEICGNHHLTEKQALECEADGVADPTIFPVGFMKEVHMHGTFVGIFAIPPYEKGARLWNDRKEHLWTQRWWACRKHYGDSLGDSICGGNDLFTNKEAKRLFDKWRIKHDIVLTPEFDRMVRFLEREGIKPSYRDEFGSYIIIDRI